MRVEDCSWETVKKKVDKVHKHVCGHAPYYDIKMMLMRNNFWNDSFETYLNETVEKCTACGKTSQPRGSRKVSLSSMSREFNDVVCVDHLLLNEVCVFHGMDTVTRYPSCAVVPDTSLSAAVIEFDACWLGQFSPPATVYGDTAFDRDEFKTYLGLQNVALCPIPPRRHSMCLNPSMALFAAFFREF